MKLECLNCEATVTGECGDDVVCVCGSHWDICIEDIYDGEDEYCWYYLERHVDLDRERTNEMLDEFIDIDHILSTDSAYLELVRKVSSYYALSDVTANIDEENPSSEDLQILMISFAGLCSIVETCHKHHDNLQRIIHKVNDILIVAAKKVREKEDLMKESKVVLHKEDFPSVETLEKDLPFIQSVIVKKL